ncbi:hypothetical protein BDN72DRAFT_832355 [Pluteus cervinus]|uniref:Uncharacterized protein n=1 Tax=Pluteus cervinus TaxID=181527 RepID=A0ACD3BAW7_9AGAR|nr:hypothetical protein BDN72DRAFT_832355 [Pluteus cervinus]
MSAKFLCCLPLRLGVLIISFVQFLICFLVAGLMWFALHVSEHAQTIPPGVKRSVIIFAVVYSFAGLISFIGFIGAIARKHGFVRTFALLLQFCLGFQIGSGIYFLISFLTNKGDYIKTCLDNATNDDQKDACTQFSHINNAAVILGVLIPIFIQGYASYVVSAYATRLAREKASSKSAPKSGTYQPVHGETYPLTQPASYPYADNTHSFGSKSAA